MTRTPLSMSKGQRSRLPGRFTHRGINASGSCSGERGNVLAVGTYCHFAVCTLQVWSARWREALRRPRREERGGGILWRPPAYSLSLKDLSSIPKIKGYETLHSFALKNILRHRIWVSGSAEAVVVPLVILCCLCYVLYIVKHVRPVSHHSVLSRLTA